MAQATVPRRWRYLQRPVAQELPARARAKAGSARRAAPRSCLKLYACLALATAVMALYVALCGFVSELDAVKYRLQEQVAYEQSHQASLVRQINNRAGYEALLPVVKACKMTSHPAGVLVLKAPVPLPADRPTILRSPQPYRAYASNPSPTPGAKEGPAMAAMHDLP